MSLLLNWLLDSATARVGRFTASTDDAKYVAIRGTIDEKFNGEDLAFSLHDC